MNKLNHFDMIMILYFCYVNQFKWKSPLVASSTNQFNQYKHKRLLKSYKRIENIWETNEYSLCENGKTNQLLFINTWLFCILIRFSVCLINILLWNIPFGMSALRANMQIYMNIRKNNNNKIIRRASVNHEQAR